MPLLLVATLWYVILTTVLSIGQYYVERYYARGNEPAATGALAGRRGQPAAVRAGPADLARPS